MTRADALRALLAKVEAGEARWSGALIYKAFGGHRQKLFHEAFHGSFDAAKALHEAVLPGWMWKIKPHNVWVDEKFGLRRIGHIGHCHDNPARAWLICILKALIATEDN